MIELDIEQFMTDGYLILRGAISPEELEPLRESAETAVRRCFPEGIPEGMFQPLVRNFNEVIDEETANLVEMFMHEATCGVASRLMPDAKAVAPAGMFLMCNPVQEHGPWFWHRDINPETKGPLVGLQQDMLANGPVYLHFNIALYDDDVYWVVPGSHLRLNTDQENNQLLADPRVPLPNGIQTHLKAGDGVVYILPILHWGSNYSTKMRRTIHGGFSNHTQYPNLDFVTHLSASGQKTFKRWERRSIEMQDHTESALRAAIKKDSHDYHSNLEKLSPSRQEKGKMLTTIFLSKAVCFINLNKNPDFEGISDDLRQKAPSAHPTTLNWGTEFAHRFSVEEAKILWDRFRIIEAKLQAEEEHFYPGFQSGPMRYFFNQMPAGFNVTDLIASWSDS